MEVIRIVESYVFRRAIAGIPTEHPEQDLRRARPRDRQGRLPGEPEGASCSRSRTRGCRPTRSSAARSSVKDVYNFRSRNYLLRKLENFDHKEPIDVDSYTIEHVMPQNPDLSPEWQDELGPDWKAVQERWLHTIGNLTLTGYNPELSDQAVQREADNEGRVPGQPAAAQPIPGPARALERARRSRGALEQLADLALTDLAGAGASRGNAGQVPQGQATAATVYTLDDHTALAGSIRPLFDEFRKRSTTSTPAFARRCASSTSPTS